MPPRASGNSALKKAITELEGMVLQRRRQLDSLSEEKRRLAMRDAMVCVLSDQARALLELGESLKRSRSRSSLDVSTVNGSDSRGALGGEQQQAAGGTAPQRWLSLSGEVADVVKGLGAAASSEDGMSTDGGDARDSGDGGNRGGGGDSSGSAMLCRSAGSPPGSDACSSEPVISGLQSPDDALMAAAEAFNLGWSVTAAASRATRPQCDTSTEGLRAHLKSFVLTTAPLLIRLQRAAPDAESARARIETSRSDLMEHCALIAFADSDGAGGPSAFGAVLLSPLDAAAAIATRPPAEGSAEEPQVPAADDAHWEWAVNQMQLDEKQEEELITLLGIVGTRVARVAAERTALLQQCAACPGDAAEQERLVARISAVQRGYQIVSAAAVLAAYGSLLSADQTARFMVACYPWVCSLGGLRHTLTTMRERRATAAAATTTDAAAAADATTAAGRGRGSSAGGGARGGAARVPDPPLVPQGATGQQGHAAQQPPAPTRSNDTCSSTGAHAPASPHAG